MKTITLTKTIGILFLSFFSLLIVNLNEFNNPIKKSLKTFLLFTAILVFPFIGFCQETGGPYSTDANTVLLMHFEDNVTNGATVGTNGIKHGSGVSYETSRTGLGKCLRLDNSTSDKQSWIEVPFYNELNFTEEFSIECWFKINSWGENPTGIRNLFKKDGVDRPQDYEVILFAEGHSLQANLDCINIDDDNWGADARTDDILELNKWYHIAMYYNYVHKHLYCLVRNENYQEIFASKGYSKTPPVNSEGRFMIGYGGWNESCFDGCIDELRLSNKYRKYRDDVLKDIDPSSFKDELIVPLKDSWGSYQWPLGELFPINKETGEIFRKNHCGPTMLSRAIHYWEHPRFPSGVIQHNMSNCDWYADLENTEYLWDLMPDNFPTDVTVEEYTPAATFAMHLGTATRESYDYFACFPRFLINKFHYSPKTRLLFRDEYSHEEWINILKNELNQGRPICASGIIEKTITRNVVEGHYYVIDGYNKNNEFHTDYSLGANVWDDPDNFDFGYGMTILAFMEPDWADKTLEINVPTENSHLTSDSETEIKWESANVANVMIEYSDDAGKNWKLIIESTDASTGSYNWTVPNLTSKNYKIRISDTSELNISRRTTEFEVYVNKQFAFKNPGTDAILTGGLEQPIYWESSGVASFRLEYSMDNGATWTAIQDSVNANEKLTFTFPEINTEEGLLKATDLNSPALSYLSEKFQISTQANHNFLYENDGGTELLMHFENNLNNAVNNGMYAVEGVTNGEYVDNYKLNLGKAFQFDNGPGISPVGNHLWIYNSHNFNLRNNWTIESWINIQTIGDHKTGYFPVVIEKEDVCGILVNHNYSETMNGFHAYVNFTNEANMVFFQNQTLDFNKWYHVALISDSTSQTINFYVHDENKNLIYEEYQPFPEGSFGLPKQNQNLLTIGGNPYGNRFFDGYLDEVRVKKSSTLNEFIETADLPFYDEFINDYTNWNYYSVKGDENWHLSGDDGIDGSKCARFYITSNPAQSNDDWLLTKRFDSSDYSKITVSFKYWYHGNGTMPEIFYSTNFVRDFESANWTKIEYTDWENEWIWNTANLDIQNPEENITIAIHYQSNEDNSIYFLLDDFSIEGNVTNSRLISNPDINLKIYPNPVISESVISFQTKTTEKVNLSIYDLQGRKICTLLDKTISAGTHTIQLGNQIKTSGVYFCKLTGSEGILTLKLIVNQ